MGNDREIGPIEDADPRLEEVLHKLERDFGGEPAIVEQIKAMRGLAMLCITQLAQEEPQASDETMGARPQELAAVIRQTRDLIEKVIWHWWLKRSKEKAKDAWDTATIKIWKWLGRSLLHRLRSCEHEGLDVDSLLRALRAYAEFLQEKPAALPISRLASPMVTDAIFTCMARSLHQLKEMLLIASSAEQARSLIASARTILIELQAIAHVMGLRHTPLAGCMDQFHEILNQLEREHCQDD